MKKSLNLKNVHICIEDHIKNKEQSLEERYEIYIGQGDLSVSFYKKDMSDITAIRDLFQNFINLQNEFDQLDFLKEREGDCSFFFCNKCPLKGICKIPSSIYDSRPNGDEVLKMVNKRYEMIMKESI